jgi:hypothetical protein
MDNMTRRTFVSKTQMLAGVLLGGMVFSGLASAQGYRFFPEHRRPVEATLRDLEEISSRSTYDRHQRERYDNAIRHLQQFGDRLHEGGYFDKGKLDQAIGDVQSVLDHNRMSNRAHDILYRDISDLRDLRRHFDDRNRYYR